LSNNQIPGHLFEAVIISTETNYDDQFKINKMLKNKIDRIKAKKHLMERKKKGKKKGNNLFSVVVNYQKMWSKIKNKVSFNNR